MSDTPPTDSLVQRLAVGRLAAPGCPRPRALQRAWFRTPRARRSSPVAPAGRADGRSAESLPSFGSTDRSIGPTSSMNSVDSTGTSVATAGGDVTPTRAYTARRRKLLVTNRRAADARYHTHERARRPPRRRLDWSIGAVAATSHLLERANQSGAARPGSLPSIAANAVAPGVVQRVAMGDDSIRATAPVGSGEQHTRRRCLRDGRHCFDR
jgi:hypothetical protein